MNKVDERAHSAGRLVPAAGASGYLGGISRLSGRSFASTEEATQAVLRLITEQIGMRSAFLTRIAPERNRNEISAAHNEPGGCHIPAGAVLPLSDTYCSAISGPLQPSPVLIGDTHADPVFSSHPAAAASPDIGSFIGVPVSLSGGVFYGTLCAVDPEPRGLTPEQADLLAVLARLLATQIERDRELANRRELERRLAEDRFRALVRNSSDVIFVVNAEGTIQFASPSVERVLGHRIEVLLGTSGFELMHPDDISRVRGFYEDVLRDPGITPSIELRLRHRDGTWRHIEVTGSNALGDPGVGGVVFNARDVTERKRAEDALRRSEGRFRSLVQNASDVVAVLTADGTVVYESPALERVLGYKPEDMVGRNALGPDLIHPEDIGGVRALFAGLLGCPEGSVSAEIRVRHADRSWRHIEAVGTNLLGDPSVGGVVINYHDITERKAYEEQLRHQAFHDPLTDFPNRALFADRLGHALARAARRGESVAVLYLDLDRFKFVNDSLGHGAGDELLAALGRRLEGCLRPEDTAARLGGDEFVVLLEEIEGEPEATTVAGRIEEALREPFELAGRKVVITASIGIAVSGPGRENPDDLVRAADIAMYGVKRSGKGRHDVYNPGMGSEARDLVALEADLRRALDRHELRLHYQPKVDLATGRIVGVEALLSWAHPVRGMVPPGAFIGLAEETGLILPIERWALREACRQAQAWQEEYGAGSSIEMAVNVSPRHFQDPELANEVASALGQTGLHPSMLTLEITESAAMGDAESSIARLLELKDLGVRLAIDDFGTGYSSLSYLHRFPVDVLKIDRSFVDGLGQESEDTVIVRAVVGLARALRLEVVAEGVETAEQAEALRALGCELAQGYLFSRPLPPEGVGEILTKSRGVVERRRA